jgi:hypothetical protein
MDGQPPLPQGLNGSASILHYVQFVMGGDGPKDEAAEELPQDTEVVSAYIKGGVASWQGQPAPAVDEAVERTMLLYVTCDDCRVMCHV